MATELDREYLGDPIEIDDDWDDELDETVEIEVCDETT